MILVRQIVKPESVNVVQISPKDCRRQPARAVLGAAILVLYAGCGELDSTTDRAETPPLFDASVTTKWTAGGIEESGGVVLESIPWRGAVGGRGHSAVVDRMAARVTVFDPVGEVVTTIGRRGAGPGEFQDPWEAGFSGDSLLWISDGSTGRITWFTLDGHLVATRSYERTQVPESSWSVRGNWALSGRRVLGYPSGGPEGSDGDHPSVPLALWTEETDLEVVDWVEFASPRTRMIETSLGLHIGGPQPINGAPIINVAAGGQWFFVLDRTPVPEQRTRGEILIIRYRPDGAVLDSVGISYRPEPVTEDDVRWLRRQAAALVRQIPEGTPGAVTAEDVLDATWIPETLPPVRSASADSRGFWLERDRRSPGTWERYDLDGNLVARIALPERVSVLAATETHLLGTSRDSLSIGSVAMYEVEFNRPPDDSRSQRCAR